MSTIDTMNHDVEFKVANFTLSPIESAHVLLSPDSVVKISNPSMVAILQRLAEHCHSTLSGDVIRELIESKSLPVTQALRFLVEDAKILSPKGNRIAASPFERVLILGNNLAIKDSMRETLAVDGVETVNDDDFDDSSSLLIVIVLGAYDPQLIKTAYKKYATRSSNRGFLTAYFVGRDFIIDGIYIPAYGTPCHFCHAERWRALHNGMRESKPSWTRLVDFFVNQAGVPVPEPKLTTTEIGYTAHLLAKAVSFFAGEKDAFRHLEDIQVMTIGNLDLEELRREPISHWDACDCKNAEENPWL